MAAMQWHSGQRCSLTGNLPHCVQRTQSPYTSAPQCWQALASFLSCLGDLALTICLCSACAAGCAQVPPQRECENRYSTNTPQGCPEGWRQWIVLRHKHRIVILPGCSRCQIEQNAQVSNGVQAALYR